MLSLKRSRTSTRIANFQDISVGGLRYISNALLVVIVLLIGCAAPTSGERPATSTLAATTSTSVARETVPNVEVTLTLTSVPTATISPTVAAIAHSASETVTSTPTLEPTLEEPHDWQGEQLITIRPDGIYRVALDTAEAEVIVPRKDEWRLFNGKPSYDGREVIYWFVEDDRYQVWVVNAIDGDSIQLLDVVDNGFTRADGDWLGRDRFFELGIRGEDENGVPLVVQWYLFDIPQGKIVETAGGRPGTRVCHTLAISPESGQVATWCSFASQFEDQNEYTVIEADGESWQTASVPEQVLIVTYELGEQIWSPDGDYVLIPDGSNATLVYVSEPRAYQLFENDDIYINTYLAQFSPNSKILSYKYDICEQDNFCVKLMDLETRSVIWESTGLFSHPVIIEAWSPDGKFFVLKTKEGSFIIDLSDFSVVRTLQKELITTVETAWLDN